MRLVEGWRRIQWLHLYYLVFGFEENKSGAAPKVSIWKFIINS
jgi:hypothetical protein